MSDDQPSNPPFKPRGMLAWFAANHVAANMIMLFLLLAGAITLFRIVVEIFPTIDADMITVRVPYLGATPQEVEEAVNVRVEEAIAGVEGVKKLRSVAVEGMGTVIAELESYADDRKALDDIKNEVDRIDTFPDQTEQPIISEVTNRTQVLTLAIYGDADERTLKNLAERVRDDLTGLENISQVEIAGVRDFEISIEVSEEALRRWGLSFQQVADAVRESSFDLPGGTIKTQGGEILLRAKGQRYTAEDFRTVVVLAREDGTRLLLEDVATIIDGFADVDIAGYFDGQPAVLVNIFRVGEQDALDVAATVDRYVEQNSSQLPAGVKMATWFDRSVFLRGRLELLLRNAAFGLTLVFLTLALFLELRLAFWVTMGIPISFLGCLWLLPAMGVSINMISLFAFIIVLGIVVDDAIVVGEAIFAHRQEGMGVYESAVRGVHEMAGPVTFAVLTTIAAFLPLLFVEGMMGKILWVIPVVVVSVLVISLVEALIILPAHLSFEPRGGAPGPIARIQTHVRHTLQWFIDKPYSAALKWAIQWRYLTLAIATSILLITVGLLAGGILKFTLFPQLDADNVWASLSMPQGTPLEQTRAVVERIERAADELEAELQAESPDDAPRPFVHISTTIGSQPFGNEVSGGPMALATGGAGGAHLAEVNIELPEGEHRTVSARDVARRWREKVGPVPGVSRLTFTSALFSAGEAINVELTHQNFDTLLAAAEQLKQIVAEYPGTSEIADSFEPGKMELKLNLTDRGRAAGLALDDLAWQVRSAFYGNEVQRIQRGRDEVKVMVRYPHAQRRSMADLHELRLRLPDGTQVPFAEAATVVEGQGYATINRADRRRVVSVTADVDDAVANANELNRRLRDIDLPQLQREFPGLAFSFEGEQREQQESMGSLRVNAIVGLLLIFGLLGVLFRSYVQPVIVMTAIPFGFVGAVVGHIIMGYPLTLLSMFGLVALSGVVVNDSLIMIDLINRDRAEGLSLEKVLMNSGTRRFRPIMLTTATTFFGLMPMILETSLQARFLIPMAISLGFGVVFATAITLLLVPSFYMILEDAKLAMGLGETDHPLVVARESAHATS